MTTRGRVAFLAANPDEAERIEKLLRMGGYEPHRLSVAAAPAAEVAEAIAAEYGLTPRERMVVEGVALGMDDDAISQALSVKSVTIARYRTQVRAKVGSQGHRDGLVLLIEQRRRDRFADSAGRVLRLDEAPLARAERATRQLRRDAAYSVHRMTSLLAASEPTIRKYADAIPGRTTIAGQLYFEREAVDAWLAGGGKIPKGRRPKIPVRLERTTAEPEVCCFCDRPTKHWTALPDREPEDQVACCKSCAIKRRWDEVPTKIEWCLAAE